MTVALTFFRFYEKALIVEWMILIFIRVYCMATSNPSMPDQQDHNAAIRFLARQYHLKENTVRSIYERELKMFNSTKNIDQYLSLLTSRHVKELMKLGLIDTI